MRWLESNLVVIFWAIVFGEVMGYIGQSLEQMTYQPMQIGGTMAIVALIAVNGIHFLSRDSKTTKN